MPVPSAPVQRSRSSRGGLPLRVATLLTLGTAAIWLVIFNSDGCACGEAERMGASAKSALRNLLEAESMFHADSGRYTTDVRRLGFSAPSNVQVTIDTATATGYRARAAWPDWQSARRGDGLWCALWVGDSTLAQLEAPEGRPVCQRGGR